VNTQQAGEGLASSVVNCGDSGGTVIACSSRRVYKWSINRDTNLNLVYSHTGTRGNKLYAFKSSRDSTVGVASGYTDRTENVYSIIACFFRCRGTCSQSCSLATAFVLSPVYTALAWQSVYTSQYYELKSQWLHDFGHRLSRFRMDAGVIDSNPLQGIHIYVIF
jgi:hypothetical protein